MQRYSDGLAVPKYQMDSFSGETTSAVGRVILELTYVPKSLNDILVFLGNVMLGVNRHPFLESITGKTLRVKIHKLSYMKSEAETLLDAGSVGIPATHKHNITLNTEECGEMVAANEAQDPIAVHYKVA